MISEYVAWRLARDRMAELRRDAAPRAAVADAPVASGRGRTAACQAVRRALTVRDLGRLALVALLAALLGVGAVGLLAAAMERRDAEPASARP
jgi:hypothetical protein